MTTDWVRVARTQLRIESSTQCSITNPTFQCHKSFRAARLVDDTTRFVVVTVGRKLQLRREMVIDIIQNGLECHGKRYAWLGFTEIQLKANQFVLFREDGEWTVERLVSLLGDFTAVYERYGYAGYVARMGLSFASTSVALKVPPNQMIRIPDKRAVDMSLTTEGIGMIRESLAKEVRAALGLPEDTSVFQARLGGIKGTFCAYSDDIFDGLVHHTGKTIAYRPSMYQYDSNLTEFEVCNVSRSFGPARLSIRLILVFISLGVPLETFEQLLSEYVQDLSSFSQDRNKALEMLKWSTVELGERFYQELHNLLLSGHDLNEPYLKNMMRQYQQDQYRNLYDKLGVEVKNSARLCGVADEEGVLGDDQVCVNLPNRIGVCIGSVVVSRTWAYDTGDIRVLTAVHKPELAHLKNCIVFPTKCQCSITGGNLDGEMYFVTWDPRLIPPEVDPPPRKRTNKSSVVPIQSNAGGGILVAAKTFANTRHQSWVNWVRSSLSLGYAITPGVLVEEEEKARKELQKRMQVDAAETFVTYRMGGQGLLGEMCTFWEIVTKSSGDRAKSELSRELVTLIEAMDIGSDLAVLGERFLRVKKKALGIRIASDPVQILRKRIPKDPKPEMEMETYRLDPVLDVRAVYPGRWECYYQEACGLCEKFEKQFERAVEMDKEDLLGLRRSSGYESYADSVKREWIEEYFSGTTPAWGIRASAWYCYGYQMKKVTFAWLGMCYLNTMKTSARPVGDDTTASASVVSPNPRSPTSSLTDREEPPCSPVLPSSPYQSPSSLLKAELDEWQPKVDKKPTECDEVVSNASTPPSKSATVTSAPEALLNPQTPDAKTRAKVPAPTKSTFDFVAPTTTSSTSHVLNQSSSNGLPAFSFKSIPAQAPGAAGSSTKPPAASGQSIPSTIEKSVVFGALNDPPAVPKFDYPGTSASSLKHTPSEALTKASSLNSTTTSVNAPNPLSSSEAHTTTPTFGNPTSNSGISSTASVPFSFMQTPSVDISFPAFAQTAGIKSTPVVTSLSTGKFSFGATVLNPQTPSFDTSSAQKTFGCQTAGVKSTPAVTSGPSSAGKFTFKFGATTNPSSSASSASTTVFPIAAETSATSSTASPCFVVPSFVTKPAETTTASSSPFLFGTKPSETVVTNTTASSSPFSFAFEPTKFAASSLSKTPLEFSCGTGSATAGLNTSTATAATTEFPFETKAENASSPSGTLPASTFISPAASSFSAEHAATPRISPRAAQSTTAQTAPDSEGSAPTHSSPPPSSSGTTQDTTRPSLKAKKEEEKPHQPPVTTTSSKKKKENLRQSSSSSSYASSSYHTSEHKTPKVISFSLKVTTSESDEPREKERPPPRRKFDATDVYMNPKPQEPVGTDPERIPPCGKGAKFHSWHCYRANGCWRRYTCQLCRIEVEENKVGGYWNTYRLPRSSLRC